MIKKILKFILIKYHIYKQVSIRFIKSFDKSPISAIAHNCCVVYVPSLREYYSIHEQPFVNNEINVGYKVDLQAETNVNGRIIDNKFLLTSISNTKTPFHTIKDVPKMKNTLKIIKSSSFLLIGSINLLKIVICVAVFIIIIYLIKNIGDENSNNNYPY